MKKITKILLGCALAITMIVTGAFAAVGYQPRVTKAATATVNTADVDNYVKATNGYAEVGSKASASGTFTAANGYNHKGLVLTGGVGATFDLGVIDISKSHWTMPEGDTSQGHDTVPESLSAFITWNYAIHNANETPELTNLRFTISDYNDPTNRIIVRWRSVNSTSTSSRVDAAATGQTYGAFRKTVGYVSSEDGWVTKDMTHNNVTKQLGFNGSGSAKNTGSNIPMSLIYDTNKNCLYSTVTYTSNTNTLFNSFAIRDFDEEAYDSGETVSGESKWNGFKSNLVNVKVTFVELVGGASGFTETSIVVRSLGGKSLGGSTLTVEDSYYYNAVSDKNLGATALGDTTIYAPVKKCAFDESFIPNSYVEIIGNEVNDSITFTNESATYNFKTAGEYTLKFYDAKNGTLIGTKTLTVGSGSKLSNEYLGDITTNGTAEYGVHTLKRYSGVTVEGLRLSGAEGSLFNLGTFDISGGKWNGTETTLGTAPETTFEFYFDHVADRIVPESYDTTSIDVILTDVLDPSKYITVRYKIMRESTYANATLVYTQAAANNQEFGGWRADKTTVVGNNSQAHIIKSADAEVLGYGSEDITLTSYGSTAPFSFVYDQDKNSLYRTTVGSANESLKNNYIVRNFGTEKYPAYAGFDAIEDTDATWDGFTSSLVNVSVSFTDTYSPAYDFAMVVTKVGNVTLGEGASFTADERKTLIPEVPTTVKSGDTVPFKAPTVGHNLYSSFLNGAKAKITQGEELVSEITFNSATENYVFESAGEYALTYYDQNGDAISEAFAITVNDYYLVNLTVNNAKAFVGETEVTNETGLQLQYGNEIVFKPNLITYTETYLTDVREFILNNVQYAYDTLNLKNNEELPLIPQDNEYVLVVNEAVLSNATINLTVTFDKYCKVTFIDEYVADKVHYAWQTTDTVNFPNAIMNNNGYHYGNSNRKAALAGWARTDVGRYYDVETGNVTELTKRTDGFTYDYNGVGQIFYEDKPIGTKAVITDENHKKAYTLVPDMVFKAVYLKVTYRSEFKIVSDANGNVNETYSGLRLIVEFDKNDFDEYKTYSKRTNRTTGLADLPLHNYITTQGELTEAGLTIDSILAAKTSLMGDGDWGGKLGVKNGLGLTLVSKNGNPLDSNTQVTGGTYAYYGLNDNQSGGMWLDEVYNSNYDTTYAYAITVRNLKSSAVAGNTDRTFVIATLMNTQTVLGGRTGFVAIPAKFTISTVAKEKFDSILASGTTQEEGVNAYAVSIDGETKYYSYTYEHIKWLNERGFLNHNIVKVDD